MLNDKKKITYIFLFGISIMFFACSSTPDSSSYNGENGSVQVLKAKIDSIDILEDLLVVNELIVNNDYLVTVDARQNFNTKAFKIFSLPEMGFLGSYGTKGDGPNEFNNLLATSVLIVDQHLVVADLKYVRYLDLNWLDTKDGSKTNWVADRKEVILGEMIPLNQLLVLNDTLIGGQQDFSLNEYVFMNTKRRISFGISEYPKLREGFPEKAAYHLYQYYSRQKPDRSKIVSAYTNFPCIKVYDVQNDNSKMGCISPENQQVEDIQTGPREMSINTFDLLKYHDRVKVNDQLIAALYEESKIVKVAAKDDPEKYSWQRQSLTPKYFQLYDWEGHHLLSLEIPNWVKTFDLSPGNLLYFVHPEVSDKIFSINVNDYLSID